MKPRVTPCLFLFALATMGPLAVACSSSTVTAASPDAPAATPEPASTTDASDPVPVEAGPSCAPPPSKSSCGESAWVRGVAHFDPSKLTGKKPVLRVALRHAFALVPGEEKIGGRLHGYVSVPVTKPSQGEQAFAIDMCDFGTSMWSEENGAFNLVLIIDENDDNDLDSATSNQDALLIAMPTKGELAKLTNVDVSCNAPSACLDVTVDCTDASCLAIEPIKSCKTKTPGCKSDDSFCK